MKTAEFTDLNSLAPDLELIKELREKHIIKEGSPLWWSIDYNYDPREYLPFELFKERWVHVGTADTTSSLASSREYHKSRDVYLYPNQVVPMSVLELDVDGRLLPLILTARPYHPKEVWFNPQAPFILKHPLETLPEYAQKGGSIDLPSHFYPQIRGLFVGKRGNHLFWYPLHEGFNVAWDAQWKDFGKPLHQTLEGIGLGFMEVYHPPMTDERTYSRIWEEFLIKKPYSVDFRQTKWVNFPYDEVSTEEFLETFRDKHDLLLRYPLRNVQLENILPLVVSTRDFEGTRTENPVVLGIYGENGAIGRCRRGGILRIKDIELAASISQAMTEDFQIPIETLLFIPQKGKPKYERISAS